MAVLVLLSTGLSIDQAQAHVRCDAQSCFTFVGFTSAQWKNYDQTGQSTDAAKDWPIGLLFYNQANVPKVKGILGGKYPNIGSFKYLEINGLPPFYDRDGGRKTPNMGSCPNKSDRHYRVYAPNPPDYFSEYGVNWGYWVVGSAHFDLNEGCSGDRYGYSETAEAWVVYDMRTLGYYVYEDYTNMYNQSHGWPNSEAEGNHIWLNDGMASAFYIP